MATDKVPRQIGSTSTDGHREQAGQGATCTTLAIREALLAWSIGLRSSCRSPSGGGSPPSPTAWTRAPSLTNVQAGREIRLHPACAGGRAGQRDRYAVLAALSAKLGIVTGRSALELCRDQFPTPVVLAMWAASEVAAMATDLAEFLGGAIGLSPLFPAAAAGRHDHYGDRDV